MIRRHFQEGVARHHALANGLNAFLRVGVNGRTYELAWNLLGLDKNSALRRVFRRQQHDGEHADRRQHHHRQQKIQNAPFQNDQRVFK